MDLIQKRHEQDVGDEFIAWYNEQERTAYRFVGRAGDAPDLIYADGDAELRLEVTAAYYDSKDAAIKWHHARGVANAPEIWSGVNFSDALARHVGELIARKSLNSYGGRCFLVVSVNPAITLASELQRRLQAIPIPEGHSFSGIYLAGRFGTNGREAGGYRCWKLA